MESLIQLDHQLFDMINTGLSNPVFDLVLPYCREKLFWAPLYLFAVLFSVLNFGKKGWLIVGGMLLCVALADMTSSNLIKKNVKRLRPCNEPVFREHIQLRVNCGAGYSFTSSHACNHFAVAVFLMGIYGRFSRWIRPVLLFWAGLIAFSQVYVGVHFPGDVLVGGMIGSGIGWVVQALSKNYLSWELV